MKLGDFSKIDLSYRQGVLVCRKCGTRIIIAPRTANDEIRCPNCGQFISHKHSATVFESNVRASRSRNFSWKPVLMISGILIAALILFLSFFTGFSADKRLDGVWKGEGRILSVSFSRGLFLKINFEYDSSVVVSPFFRKEDYVTKINGNELVIMNGTNKWGMRRSLVYEFSTDQYGHECLILTEHGSYGTFGPQVFYRSE